MPKNHDFASIDAQIAALDLTAFAPGGTHHFTAGQALSAPGDVLKKVCAIYQSVRGILVLLEGFPLLPSKWRQVLGTFTGLLDQICPT